MPSSGDIPNLGIGIGLRSAHYREIFAAWPAIDWFEIIAENFAGVSGRPAQNLERILERYPVVLHGVSIGIGSPDPLDFEWLTKLKALIRKTKTPWFSDHLCWGRLEGAHYHDLLPLPYRKDVCDYVAERARIIQDFLEVPFALENVSAYAGYRADEMSEWDFYSAVVEKADVKMMLDVNNIYVSSRNHGFSPASYYADLPFERIVQIHLAGHSDYDAYCLDTHDHTVADEVWKIYGDVIRKVGPISTLLEWDDHFISFEDTWKEALKAKAYLNELAGVKA